MTHQYDHILAKSEKHGSVPLARHLAEVASISRTIAAYANLDQDIAYKGAVLHDIGKTSHLFQQSLRDGHQRAPGKVFRHEIASLFFLPLLEEEQKWPVVDMVVAHHKSIYQDAGKKGLLDLVEQDRHCLDRHLQGFDQWSGDALGILASFGFNTKPVTETLAKESFWQAVEHCESKRYGHSRWKGLLVAADHLASALADKGEGNRPDLFITPDLGYYHTRKNVLYPLSLIATDDPRPHSLVTAPTGAGKTDFLIRRCRGRVFYTLPFQASINAMYERIKDDLKDTRADVRLLHASSSLKLEGKAVVEQIMQRHIGASVKVLTPHQMASIAFGTKGYEAMIMDLQGCDVILDEIHTYAETTQAIVLKIVEILHSLGCRLHIGTATMPTVLYNKVAALLGGSDQVYEVKLTDQQLDSFDRHTVHKATDPAALEQRLAEAVEAKQKVLVVCNQVKRAQQRYEELSDMFPRVKRMLIHSRFKRGRRNELESQLRDVFNHCDEACIVVSTQVVEVSLDISFDMMVTECAPIDALIQRFGRINRKRTEKTIGHYKPIYVLPPPEGEKAALPYGREVLERTFKALPDGGLLRERDAQRLIDEVYPAIEFVNIDLNAVFKDGKWRVKELWHNPKSALLDAMDIDSVCCIEENDREAYETAHYAEQSRMEIPVSFRSIGYRGLDKLSVGSAPFVVPSRAYDEETGLLADLALPEFYDVTQRFL